MLYARGARRGVDAGMEAVQNVVYSDDRESGRRNEYVRVGSFVIGCSWARIWVFSVFLVAFVAFLLPPVLHTSLVVLGYADVALGGAPVRRRESPSRASRERIRSPHPVDVSKSGVMAQLCGTDQSWLRRVRVEGGGVELLHFASRTGVVRSAVGFEARFDDVECVWRDKATATVPFGPMCVLPMGVDSQVSKALLEGGEWDNGRRRLWEDMLPTMANALDRGAGRKRLVAIDVGAHVGYFSLVAAARGYDVIAVEPTRLSAATLVASVTRIVSEGSNTENKVSNTQKEVFYGDERNVHNGRWIKGLISSPESLQASTNDRTSHIAREEQFIQTQSIQTSKPVYRTGPRASDEAVRAATERLGSVAVLWNAAAEGYGTVRINWSQGNPGANYVTEASPSDSTDSDTLVDAIPLDAILEMIDAKEIQAVKISAEMLDGRVLEGARRILGEGKPPFVMLIFNRDHLRNAGCDPYKFPRTMVEWGYRVWDHGILRTQQNEIEEFVRNIQGSHPVLFVHSNYEF